MCQLLADVPSPVVGTKYMVPCVVVKHKPEHHTDLGFLYNHFSHELLARRHIWQVTPVLDHPHSDRENGQDYSHYHLDYRFCPKTSEAEHIVLNTPLHIHAIYMRLRPAAPAQLELYPLVLQHTSHILTDVALIAKSKLKHNCIHKGKCPHRGYDLSNTQPINGVITCPLHGLRFDALTKQLLNDPTIL